MKKIFIVRDAKSEKFWLNKCLVFDSMDEVKNFIRKYKVNSYILEVNTE